MMKLMHKLQLIGTIENASLEGMAMYGDIKLTDAADRYLDMFSYFDSNFDPYKEPPLSRIRAMGLDNRIGRWNFA